MQKVHIPQPENVRKIQGSFAWVDHRLLREGYLPVMTHQDLSFYLFLLLAADCNGVSFYRKEKICDILSLDFQQFEVARDRLSSLNLIALSALYGPVTQRLLSSAAYPRDSAKFYPNDHGAVDGEVGYCLEF